MQTFRKEKVGGACDSAEEHEYKTNNYTYMVNGNRFGQPINFKLWTRAIIGPYTYTYGNIHVHTNTYTYINTYAYSNIHAYPNTNTVWRYS
jgi:hypothetical protein